MRDAVRRAMQCAMQCRAVHDATRDATHRTMPHAAQLLRVVQACELAGDAAGAKEADERLGFLTPILKGFLTEVGKEAADLGMQAPL